jgi:ribosomal protein S1
MSQPASIALVTSAELDKVLQNRPNLKPGDKIEGKVIKIRDDGKAVIDFGKFQAAVELKTEVKQGDVIR